MLNQIITGLYRASIYWLIASGLTLIFGVLRVVNFAQATLLVLGGYMAFTFYAITGNFWISIPLSAISVGLIGLLSERLLLKPIYKVEATYQLLMTFAIALIINDLAKLTWGKLPVLVPLPDILKISVEIFGRSLILYVILIIVTGLAVYIAMALLINNTMWGLRVRATWRRPEIAESLRINTSTIYSSVFFLGCAISGMGGALMVAFSPVAPGLGDFLIVSAFIVTVIAGMGNLLGAYIASIIIGVSESLFTLYLPEIDLLLIYLIMAISLLLRPQGIFGER
ncbi:MAG: branched-chain amino acid ABC transporter permease [Desulfurococcaceae archaeon]|nr:MAG: branched-chain amino acid ABC transporter permease [Desulfurococcaceae archaeon]